MIENKDLKRRIIEITYKKGLSHIGSSLTAVDIINDIYQKKEKDEEFVLSSGHAGLALYVVLEKYEGLNAEEIFDHHGVHPDRCSECHISVSSGSLGHGLGIALGMALADRSKNVYCLISDGECSEGSLWEAMRVQKELYVDNLFVTCNINGWGAYKQINPMQLRNQLEYMSWVKSEFTSLNGYPAWLQDQDAHYLTLDKEKYQELLKLLA